MVLNDGRTIQAGAFGAKDTGNIHVSATDSMVLSGPSPIQVIDVPMQRGGTMRMLRPFTGIFALAGLLGGKAGNVRMDASRIEVREGAQISTTRLGPGAGGIIQLNGETVSVYEGGCGRQAVLHAAKQGSSRSRLDHCGHR